MVDFSEHRAAIEELYTGVCTITNRETTIVDGISESGNAEICKNQPCRLSYKSFPQSVDGDEEYKSYQQVKLFISPEVNIPTGSRIEVTQAGRTQHFVASGIPAVYDTHQEISLEVDEVS